MGSKIKSIKKAKTQLGSMKTQMRSYAEKLINAKDTLNTMMKGNGTDAYWQGQSAVEWYTSAIASINKMMDNYKNTYNEFRDYAVLVEKAKTKAELKGLSKALRQKYVAQCTGSTFTSGVKRDLANEKISPTLPATVNADVANDDQTRQSFSAYIRLKNSLTGLQGICEKINVTWQNAAANTSGKMNSDANTRAKQIAARKKEIAAAASRLEENYVGDMLFS